MSPLPSRYLEHPGIYSCDSLAFYSLFFFHVVYVFVCLVKCLFVYDCFVYFWFLIVLFIYFVCLFVCIFFFFI